MAFNQNFKIKEMLTDIKDWVSGSNNYKPKVELDQEIIFPEIPDETTDVTSGTRLQSISDRKKLDIPTYDGTGKLTHPSVLYFGDGWNGHKFWMAMTPLDSTEVENPSIVVSDDGEEWFEPTGITNPLDFPDEDNYMSDPELVYIREGNKLRCYYRENVREGNNRLFFKESSDGVNWGEREECTFETYRDPLSPSIIQMSSSRWLMWVGKTGFMPYLYLYESSDGKNWGDWVKCHSNVDDILDFWHPEVRMHGGEFIMTCPSSPQNRNFKGNGNTHKDLYFGTSTDGVNWTIDTVPFLRRDDQWDLTLYRSSLVFANGKALLYASGWSYDGSRDVFLVECLQRNNLKNQLMSRLEIKEIPEEASFSGNLGEDVIEILDVKEPIVIENFTLSSDNAFSNFQIQRYSNIDFDRHFIKRVSSNGSTVSNNWRFADLANADEVSVFKKVEYDTEESRFSVTNRKEILCPYGARVTMYGSSGNQVSGTVGYRVLRSN